MEGVVHQPEACRSRRWRRSPPPPPTSAAPRRSRSPAARPARRAAARRGWPSAPSSAARSRSGGRCRRCSAPAPAPRRRSPRHSRRGRPPRSAARPRQSSNRCSALIERIRTPASSASARIRAARGAVEDGVAHEVVADLDRVRCRARPRGRRRPPDAARRDDVVEREARFGHAWMSPSVRSWRRNSRVWRGPPFATDDHSRAAARIARPGMRLARGGATASSRHPARPEASHGDGPLRRAQPDDSEHVSYALPLGYPATAVTCDVVGCDNPARLWLDQRRAQGLRRRRRGSSPSAAAQGAGRGRPLPELTVSQPPGGASRSADPRRGPRRCSAATASPSCAELAAQPVDLVDQRDDQRRGVRVEIEVARRAPPAAAPGRGRPRRRRAAPRARPGARHSAATKARRRVTVSPSMRATTSVSE